MSMGPPFNPRSTFKTGDIRLFCAFPRHKDTFPKYFPQIPVRLLHRTSGSKSGAAAWTYEDLTTGEQSTKYYDDTCFSMKTLTEMEVLAWAAK
jgi:hypothetical protein